VPEKPPKDRAHTSRNRFFALFWQITTVAIVAILYFLADFFLAHPSVTA